MSCCSRIQTSARNNQRSAANKGRRAAEAPERSRRPAVTSNQILQAMLADAGIQPKLEISQPGDREEQEADQVADSVMRMGNGAQAAPQEAPKIQRKCSACQEEERVQRQPLEEEEEEEEILQTSTQGPGDEVEEHPRLARKAAQPGPQAATASAAGAISGLRTGGRPLPAATRAYFEPRFAQSFEHVRIHTGSAAATAAGAVGARAFTLGNNVVFGASEYRPDASEGRHLLAHELTHVVQQDQGRASRDRLHPMRLGTGATPRGNYHVAPAAEQGRVNSGIAIVRRIADNPRNFPRCHRYFRDNCPGGTINTMKTNFDATRVWKRTPNPENWYGSTHGNTNHMAYTMRSYNIGRWTLAATFVHEMMHGCGQNNEATCEGAVTPCGRLPTV